jgi:hypothetical protein
MTFYDFIQKRIPDPDAVMRVQVTEYHSIGNEKRLHLPEPTEFTQPDLV